jgi:hypothetical protein
MTGRPSKYTPELGEKIANLLAEGKSLRRICDSNPDLPDRTTLLRWACDPKHPFYDQYARGRDMQADTLADDIIDIADEATTKDEAQIARVRVDSRKWIASKLKPKRYGDKLALEGVENGAPIKVENYPAMTREQALKLLKNKKPEDKKD